MQLILRRSDGTEQAVLSWRDHEGLPESAWEAMPSEVRRGIERLTSSPPETSDPEGNAR